MNCCFFLVLFPALIAGECDPHPEPVNGHLVDSIWIPGGKAIHCFYGYVPVDSGLATCKDNVWSEILECDEAVVMLVGGDEEEGFSDRVEVFSSSSTCMKPPALPQAAHGAVGGWVGGMAVVCGGEPEVFGMSNKCFAYSPERNTWVDAPQLKIARSMSSAAVLDGAMLISGGYNEDYYSTALTELWIPAVAGLDTPWVDSDPLPQVRADHCSAVMADATSISVIVTGNYPETHNINMAETSKLVVGDDGHFSWSSLPDMLLDRDDHGCSLVSTSGKVEVLVAGGPDTGRAEIFDPVSVNWRSVATMTHTAFGPSMAVVEGVPTVMGGYELEATPRQQNRVQQYIAEEDRWEVLEKKLEAGRSHAATISVPKSRFNCA